MAKTYQDDNLQSYTIKNWQGGYNSYSASKSNLNDDEFPVGQNVELDDNGSVTKMSGVSVYGAQIASGKAITGMGWLTNSTNNKVIVAAGTAWYLDDGSTTTALTGVSFTDSLETFFIEAMGSLYGVNKTDVLAYTSDGATITAVTNGRAGISPVYFNGRIYLIDATTGRIWYSNQYTVATSPPDITLGNFGTFNTDLTSSPVKDAGFIELFPKGGVMPTGLVVFGNVIRVTTANHGLWEIATAAANTDKSAAHTVVQRVMQGRYPSPKGVAINGADIWLYSGQGITSYGEVATFQTPRPTTKSGRIRTEMNSVAATLKPLVAMKTYNEKVYIAYGTGTFNDRLVKYDNRLNAFSAPQIGIGISCFLEIVDANGIRRLLAGSSDNANSYVYELEVGTNFNGVAINGYFEHKSIDAGHPGMIKYWAFADVFYTLLYGAISYTSYIDENTPISGVQVIGSSGTISAATGAQLCGSYLCGNDFNLETTSINNATNGHSRIDLEFTEGDKVSTRFSNANLGEQFKIDKIIYYYLPAESIYQQ